jgi:hypothetical protein
MPNLASLIVAALSSLIFVSAFTIIAWRKRRNKFLFYGGLAFVTCQALASALFLLFLWEKMRGR